MGDRVSVSFKNGDEESIVLFNHWGGQEFPQLALEYAKQLKDLTSKDGETYPLSRLEPRVVMVDFIRYLWEKGIAKGKTYNSKMQFVPTGLINDSLYFGKDENDGDNSDNGHWIIDLKAMTLLHNKGQFEADES